MTGFMNSYYSQSTSAGQAVVQMVLSKIRRQEYAIKFFLSASDFKEESALYRGGGQKGGTFAQFLPKVWVLVTL